jgi:hypothetical protein
MLDRDLVLDAIEDAQRILAEHIEPGSLIGIPRPPSTCFCFCWTGAKSWLRSDGSAMGMGCVS